MVRYLDRMSGRIEEEKIYGQKWIEILYGSSFVGRLARLMTAKFPLFSHLFGWLQKRRASRKNIAPFIEAYHMDRSEFLEPVASFHSFNDFFIRRLKPECRPIAERSVVMPADARYLVYPDMARAEGFVVKGKKFSLETLLQDKTLAEMYVHGSLVIVRLCPTDYHRFHFPVSGIPTEASLIKGPLYSVNPMALKHNLSILAENKRMITEIKTERLGAVLFIEVGATNVGSIVQTYRPNKPCAKGEEKGYFSFGGSTILLLFEPGKVHFDQDLLDASARHLEVRALMGQSLARLCTFF